ncbi:MAG: hypothetical protein IJD93_02535 [Ruminococcus sp.]|nr:hypothetical protein [Ruminococcus sp.]
MNKEVYNVQNPAIGAAILWRFICGYKSKDNKPTPFPLLFIVLPIIFREDLCAVIKSTQKKKGLSKVSEKLFDGKKIDELYSINNSAIEMRSLTLASFNVGILSNIFKMDYEKALVYALIDTNKSVFASSTKYLLDSAEKLGAWCSELTLLEISEWLKVRF